MPLERAVCSCTHIKFYFAFLYLFFIVHFFLILVLSNFPFYMRARMRACARNILKQIKESIIYCAPCHTKNHLGTVCLIMVILKMTNCFMM